MEGLDISNRSYGLSIVEEAFDATLDIQPSHDGKNSTQNNNLNKQSP